MAASVEVDVRQGPNMGTAEQQFDGAMSDIHRRAKVEANYNATRFFHMLTEHRGIETARILLHARTVSEGYTALWERKRLDLTVEALVLQPAYASLFTNSEREIARNRLSEYGYDLPDGSG